MLTIRTCAALAMTAVLGVAALAPAPAMAQSNCDWYGATALKQQQQNEKQKCGFTGDDWSPNLKAHLAWCGNVAPDVWKAAAQRRDQQLSECAQK